MRIDVKGRNLPVSEELREHVAKRFRKVGRQVSELAELEVELLEERNPAIADSEIAEATLHLKGVTLRARAASPDIVHSINMVSEELSRQVKRHRDKRRGRRQARAAAEQPDPALPVLKGELVLEGDVVLEAEVIPSTDTFGPDVSSAA
jgi:putative sigma-54 modulation protein